MAKKQWVLVDFEGNNPSLLPIDADNEEEALEAFLVILRADDDQRAISKLLEWNEWMVVELCVWGVNG